MLGVEIPANAADARSIGSILRSLPEIAALRGNADTVNFVNFGSAHRRGRSSAA